MSSKNFEFVNGFNREYFDNVSNSKDIEHSKSYFINNLQDKSFA